MPRREQGIVGYTQAREDANVDGADTLMPAHNMYYEEIMPVEDTQDLRTH